MLWVYLGFVAFILFLLALDLGVFHRKAHVVSLREAAFWSAVWIGVGVAFSVVIYAAYQMQWWGLGVAPDPVDGLRLDGLQATVKYLTGYVVEKSLAVDNIFVIAMIFAALAVPAMYQHRVLFWGIIGALLMRGVMIAVGAQLIARFDWILYVFGGFLVLTAVKMLLIKSDHADFNRTLPVRLARRIIPITERFHGEHFLVRAGGPASREPPTPGAQALPDRVVDNARPGALLATPLLLSLILVEFTDLVFAVDSIPAIFAITGDPFLVFTSNVLAILGLRSLYFLLAGVMDRFRYLKVSLALVLAVVGGKMLAHGWLKSVLGSNFNFYLLGLIALILLAGVAASLWATRRRADTVEPAPA